MTIIERINTHTRSLIDIGNVKYGMNLVVDNISWNLRGRVAGTATCQGNTNSLRYNLEAATLYTDQYLNDTVPHEVAHLFGFRMGDGGHGRQWKAICLALGGNATRCHTMALTPARVQRATRKYLYRTAANEEVWLSTTRHNKIQEKGVRYASTATGAVISSQQFTGQINTKFK